MRYDDESITPAANHCLECGGVLATAEEDECLSCINRRIWENFCYSKSDPYDHAHGLDRGGEE